MSEKVCGIRFLCPDNAARGVYFCRVFRMLPGWIDGSARLPVGPPYRGTLRKRLPDIATHGRGDAASAMDKDGS